MSKGKALYFILGIIAVIAIVWIIDESIKKSNKIKELEDELDKNKEIDMDIRGKLNDLINSNPDLAPEVNFELTQISTLIQTKQESKAAFTLGKIIEKLLKDKYKKSEKIKDIIKENNRKTPVFADYLELAKNENVINQEEYHYLSVLKLYRNEEAHELAVKKEKSKIESVFLVGMSFIARFCKKAA